MGLLEILLNPLVAEYHVFVAVVEVQLKKGMEDEFKNWVNESN